MTGDGKRDVALVAAGAIVVGSFLPWAKATTIFGEISISGFEAGDGKLTAGLGAIAALALLVGWRIVARIAGLISAAIGIYDMVDIEGVADEDVARISSSYGIWMVIVGGIVVLVQPALRRNTSQGVHTPPPTPLVPPPPPGSLPPP